MSTGMMNFPRAPEGITPRSFFEQWLPTQMEPFKGLVEAMAADLSLSIAVKAVGDSGGEWTIKLADGSLSIVPGLADDAVATMVMSEKNFVEAVTGKRDDLRMQPPAGKGGPDPQAMKEQAKRSIEALQTVHGMLRFQVEDADNPFIVTVKFAGPMKDEPDCTVRIEQEDMREMARGELDPQTAFMAGKVLIEGDMGLLMQIAPLFM